MKNIIFYFILFFSLPLFAQQKENHSFKIVYKKIPQTNEEKVSNIKNPEIRDNINTIDSYMTTLRYDLLINNDESIFYQREQMDRDNMGIAGVAEIVGGGKGIYYFNKKGKKIIHAIENGGQKYLVSIDVSKYDWKVHRETKTIAGYLCYRATAEEEINIGLTLNSKSSSPSPATRTLEVWFAPKLPSMFGPTEFVGLPGLVMQAQGMGVIFRVVSIESTENVCVEKPTNGKQVTEKEYGMKIEKGMKRIRGY